MELITTSEFYYATFAIIGLVVLVAGTWTAIYYKTQYNDKRVEIVTSMVGAIIGVALFVPFGIISGVDLSHISASELASAQASQIVVDEAQLVSDGLELKRLEELKETGEITWNKATKELDAKIASLIASIAELEKDAQQRADDAEAARQRALVEGSPQEEIEGDETATQP